MQTLLAPQPVYPEISSTLNLNLQAGPEWSPPEEGLPFPLQHLETSLRGLEGGDFPPKGRQRGTAHPNPSTQEERWSRLIKSPEEFRNPETSVLDMPIPLSPSLPQEPMVALCLQHQAQLPWPGISPPSPCWHLVPHSPPFIQTCLFTSLPTPSWSQTLPSVLESLPL